MALCKAYDKEYKEPIYINKILDCHPIFVTTAYNKIRIFLFTNREPKESNNFLTTRDIHDERLKYENISFSEQTTPIKSFPTNAIIHSSYGEIYLRLFPNECPRTVENFITHACNGYYNGLIFHRVIRGFMIQSGDPLGNGTGGQSIWGDEFEDEIVTSLRHDRPGTISMANAGANSNGSQFFITTSQSPWLDGKHTLFGIVTKGMDVVQAIERLKTDKNDKPIEAVKIINIVVD